MGWSVNGAGPVEIVAARQREAFAAVLPLAMTPELSATRPHELATSGDLISFLTRAGFHVSVDGDGDIIGLEFTTEFCGGEHASAGSLDQTVLLDALAPFVEAGGEMDFANEAYDQWIHQFDGRQMVTVDR